MKNSMKPYILLLPALFVLLGIFTSGIVIGFSQSLGYFPAAGLRDITFRYYLETINDREFLNSLKFSFQTSLISSLIAVFIGVILACLLVKSNKKSAVMFLYKLPIVVPHIVAALLAYNILSQSGILARIFYSIGIIKSQGEFQGLMFDKNGIGVIMAYVWKEIPFIAMVVYGILNNINYQLYDVAQNLGASKKQVFRYIIVPLIFPSIASSFIIIFAFSFGAFEVPYLLGPTSPKALPVKAYIEYTSPELWSKPYSMAVNSILTLVSITLIWIYEVIINKIYKKLI